MYTCWATLVCGAGKIEAKMPDWTRTLFLFESPDTKRQTYAPRKMPNRPQRGVPQHISLPAVLCLVDGQLQPALASQKKHRAKAADNRHVFEGKYT
mmetsp:Transcript_39542/g.104777  ORF Transcript_39542/g.104777 Transcript_39542/m.104777 type:complete len:96 (+) Transcript_39542:854-1141(+)